MKRSDLQPLASQSNSLPRPKGPLQLCPASGGMKPWQLLRPASSSVKTANEEVGLSQSWASEWAKVMLSLKLFWGSNLVILDLVHRKHHETLTCDANSNRIWVLKTSACFSNFWIAVRKADTAATSTGGTVFSRRPLSSRSMCFRSNLKSQEVS